LGKFLILLGWLAPEVIQGVVFSTKSDVYSFGIILWEIAARAPPFNEFPISHSHWMSDFEEEIVKGLRPTAPKILNSLSPTRKTNGATLEYTNLLQICWDVRPEIRPNFIQILPILEEMQREMEKRGKIKEGEEIERKSRAKARREKGEDKEEGTELDWDSEDLESEEETAEAEDAGKEYSSLEKFVSSISAPASGPRKPNPTATPMYPLKLSESVGAPLKSPQRSPMRSLTSSNPNPVIPVQLEADLLHPSPTPNPSFPLRLSDFISKPGRSPSQINLDEAVNQGDVDLFRLLGEEAHTDPQPPVKTGDSSQGNKKTLVPLRKHNSLMRGEKREVKKDGKHRERKEERKEDKEKDKDKHKEF
jgi:hypothetical protein